MLRNILLRILRFGLREAEEHRDLLAGAMLVAGLVLELVIIGSRGNHHRNRGHESGVWAIRMGHHWTSVTSWTSFALIGIGLIFALYALWLLVVTALIALIVMIELIFGHDLPSPQNSWVAGGSYAIVLVGSFIAMLRHSERVRTFLESLEH